MSFFAKTNNIQLVKPYLRSVQNLNNKAVNEVRVVTTLPTYDYIRNIIDNRSFIPATSITEAQSALLIVVMVSAIARHC